MTKRVKNPMSRRLWWSLPYPIRVVILWVLWFPSVRPLTCLFTAFAVGALTALAVVALNAHELYAWYWRVWVYQP